MHRTYMQFIFAICLSFTLAVNTYAADSISESDAKDLITSFHATVEKRDAEAVGDFFAKNAKIEVIMPPSLGGKKVTMDVSQFLMVLKQGWRTAETYSYELEDIEITVNADGKSASITDTMTETGKFKGGITFTTKTSGKTTISLVDGKLLITKVVSTVESME